MRKKMNLPLEVIWFFCLISLSLATLAFADGSGKKTTFKETKAPAIENRFVATGKITDIILTGKDISSFMMVIEIAEQFGEYPDMGNEYVGKTVEVISEIGIPPSFKTGVQVHVILRVAGDEWKQSLFLVDVIKNEKER